MEADAQRTLQQIRKAPLREEAVRHFLGVFEAHGEHTADVKARSERAYRFQTPHRPLFQFDVKGLDYQESRWAETDLDRVLDVDMQDLVFRLESMPESDLVPMLHTGIGKSDLIPRMFGVTFATQPMDVCCRTLS